MQTSNELKIYITILELVFILFSVFLKMILFLSLLMDEILTDFFARNPMILSGLVAAN